MAANWFRMFRQWWRQKLFCDVICDVRKRPLDNFAEVGFFCGNHWPLGTQDERLCVGGQLCCAVFLFWRLERSRCWCCSLEDIFRRKNSKFSFLENIFLLCWYRITETEQLTDSLIVCHMDLLSQISVNISFPFCPLLCAWLIHSEMLWWENI